MVYIRLLQVIAFITIGLTMSSGKDMNKEILNFNLEDVGDVNITFTMQEIDQLIGTSNDRNENWAVNFSEGTEISTITSNVQSDEPSLFIIAIMGSENYKYDCFGNKQEERMQEEMRSRNKIHFGAYEIDNNATVDATLKNILQEILPTAPI